MTTNRYTGSGKTHTVLGSGSEEGLYYKVGCTCIEEIILFTILTLWNCCKSLSSSSPLWHSGYPLTTSNMQTPQTHWSSRIPQLLDHRYMHRGYMHHGYINVWILETCILDVRKYALWTQATWVHASWIHASCIIDICIIDTCIIAVDVETEVLVNFAWVTRPERPKGAKDEVKRPERPPPRIRSPEGP